MIWTTGLALAADVACAVLPIVTGGGLAVRALAHADDVVDAAKAVDAAADGITAVSKAKKGFGTLEKAANYGIDSYNKLKSAAKGAGEEVHHLIEKRFASALGLKEGSIPSIVLTKAEHQRFTNAWRDAIGYANDNKAINTANARIEEIWQAAQKIYEGYDEILDAIRKALFP